MKRIIIIAGIILLILSGCSSSESGDSNSSTSSSSKNKVTVIDFSNMSREEIQEWGNENGINIVFNQTYSNDVEDGAFVSQSKEANKTVNEGDKVIISYSLGPEPSKEYQNALKKAQDYSDLMYMSKARLYDQLTSEYGE